MSNLAVVSDNDTIDTEPAMTEEEKRAAIRERIQAGEADLERRQDRTFTDQLTDAKEAAVEFTKRRPLTVIAGAVVAGIAVSALFRNSPTRRAGRRSAALAAIAADTVMEYGQAALASLNEAGRSGLQSLDDLGDRAGLEARTFGRSAKFRAANVSDRSRVAGRRAIKGSRRSLDRARRYFER